MILPIYTTNTTELCMWSRDYCKYGQHHQEADIRYNIGVYQIGQALKWGECASRFESFAASFMHIVGAAGMLEVKMEYEFPPDITTIRHAGFNQWQVLLGVTSAQQLFFYGGPHCFSDRRGRFKREYLRKAVRHLVRHVVEAIPKEARIDAFWNAMKIMTGRI